MFRSLVLKTATSYVKTSAFKNNTMAQNLPKTMKAVGLYEYLPISDKNSLLDLEVNVPDITDTEVLVAVKATSVNPIDTKQRAPKAQVESQPRILGWDGAGIIVDKGSRVTLFRVGDEVFFTGNLNRSGSNAEYIALDQETVGRKPKNFTFEEAAAMPLTTVTAYEALFDRMHLSEAKDKGKTLLIINSAGGVGSIASQLAKNIGMKIIGTASRTETEKFASIYGSDIVLNHKYDLVPQLEKCGYKKGVDYILVNYDPYPYWDTLMTIIKPQGTICLIVDCSGLVDIRPLKDKSVTLVSEMMGTRVKYNTEDKYRRYEILEEVSKMFEDGRLKHTLTKVMSPINAANLREAHRLIEEKQMYGKLVLSGF